MWCEVRYAVGQRKRDELSRAIVQKLRPLHLVTSSVDAVLGRSATLPCDIEPGIREDRVYMVLWYRDTHTKPIYR
ncbi:hypothetical protein BDFB_008033 [Asbolus verrucosus]|uniref:Ig-like domain-containing protein n=1 Tax=Asbolus verrucosus TaxID=1661398 RepID=A0A482WA25_ASBVE|nr:hypothetical protein BDFB_008033 [Asbolus verrucosus]